MGTGTAPLPGGGVPRGRRPEQALSYIVPLLLTGARLHPPGRTDKHLCRCFGAPARRVFPDHLITDEFGFELAAGVFCTPQARLSRSPQRTHHSAANCSADDHAGHARVLACQLPTGCVRRLLAGNVLLFGCHVRRLCQHLDRVPERRRCVCPALL